MLGVALIPCSACAWENQAVLRFISETNPIIQAQEGVVQHYRVPDNFQRIIENTKLVGRFGGVVTPIIAADDVVAAGSSKTAGVTAFGGIQVSIPLSSLDEERTLANKHVELTKAIDQIKDQTLQDMAQLRTYEADLAAAEVRMQFYRDQLRWLQKRLEEGYSEMEKLWE